MFAQITASFRPNHHLWFCCAVQKLIKIITYHDKLCRRQRLIKRLGTLASNIPFPYDDKKWRLPFCTAKTSYGNDYCHDHDHGLERWVSKACGLRAGEMIPEVEGTKPWDPRGKGTPGVSKGQKPPIQLLQLLKNSPREVRRDHFRYILGPPSPTQEMKLAGPVGEGPSRPPPPVSPAMRVVQDR